MNYLEKLLQDTPVEWKTLGEVLERAKGTKITAGQMKELHQENAPIKIFAGGKTFALVNYGDIPNKDIHTKPSIIVKSRGIIEFEYYDKPFSHKNEMWSYHSENENIDLKYVFYFLKSKELYFQQIGSKMQMPQIATPDTDNFPIPIPPLPVQKEIARILDAFTAITSELTSELTLRQKQYQYYRDKLLTFGDEVEWKTLGEVCDFQNGFAFKSSLFKESGLPIIRITNINGKTVDLSDLKYFDPNDYKKGNPLNYSIEKGDILIAMSGATTGKIGYYTHKETAYLNQRVGKFLPNKTVLDNKYLYHFLSSKTEFLYILAGGGAQPNLSTSDIKEKIKIPLPPIEEQKRIAAILDKFHTLTHSLSEGLPKEIALRQKQYEYYRDLLLNFKR
ncbi:restriction endonuclease subunit S [Avibacterium avium]|uniref:restriction endonuclease subunit S n=1 Tax=Avibacterium avium TaxID=751 RepID=UPI003BF9024E